MGKIQGMTYAALIREQRRRLILEDIIMTDPKRKWSSRMIAAAAADHPWFKEHAPTYSHMTALRDMVQIKEEISETRKELADEYIKRQLEISDDIIDDLMSDWEDLNDMDIVAPDVNAKSDFLLAKIGRKKDLVIAIERMFNRQSSLLPIEVPKKLEVEKRTLNIDMLLEMEKKAQIEAGNVIEGEVIQNDEQMA